MRKEREGWGYVAKFGLVGGELGDDLSNISWGRHGWMDLINGFDALGLGSETKR